MTGKDFANTKINICIHIHGLPYELRMVEHAKRFAQFAGRVKKSNRSDGIGEALYEGEYMKYRIELDTH